MDTADRYRRFAEREARGQSPTYERLALAVAGDGELVRLLDQLPEANRQPNLLFAAVRYLDGPVVDPVQFREWVTGSWSEVAATMLARHTQTTSAG